MQYFEVKASYSRQMGEDAPRNVNEQYVVADALLCGDAEDCVIDEIKPYVFGDWEIKYCRKVQFADIIKNVEGDFWYKARVEELVVDESGKEKRHRLTFLIQANDIENAVKGINKGTGLMNCELISIAKTNITEFLHALNVAHQPENAASSDEQAEE